MALTNCLISIRSGFLPPPPRCLELKPHGRLVVVITHHQARSSQLVKSWKLLHYRRAPPGWCASLWRLDVGITSGVARGTLAPTVQRRRGLEHENRHFAWYLSWASLVYMNSLVFTERSGFGLRLEGLCRIGWWWKWEAWTGGDDSGFSTNIRLRHGHDIHKSPRPKAAPQLRSHIRLSRALDRSPAVLFDF